MSVKKKNIQFVVPISPKYSPAEQVAIAQEVIDFVTKRTKKGVDAEGDAFPAYTGSYTKSLDFKNAGKSKKPNLVLSGDMLAAMHLVDVKDKKKLTELVLGYEADQDEAGRVEGNVIGSYGQPKGDPTKARDFLGISEEDLQKILRRYPLNNEEKREARAKYILDSAEVSEEIAARIGTSGKS